MEFVAADNFRSRFEELETQLEQLRASIAPAGQTQPTSVEVVDGSTELADSLNWDATAIASRVNSTPVTAVYASGLFSESRPDEASTLPPNVWEPPPADERSEPLPAAPAFPYIRTPANRGRTLESISLSQNQIDELFEM